VAACNVVVVVEEEMGVVAVGEYLFVLFVVAVFLFCC
jgi:hypothetical protein